MKRTITFPILTLGHFLVDLSCLYFLFYHYPQGGFIAGIQTALLYNFLAFALQAVIGYFFDRFPANRSTSIGILCILCGYLCGFSVNPVAGLILCGLGNSFYHIGGSIGISRTDKKGLRNCGIFVSTGALGVSLGIYLAETDTILSSPSFYSVSAFWIFLLLIVFLLLQILVVPSGKKEPFLLSATKAQELSPEADTALLLLSLSAVLIRSLGGAFFPVSYQNLFILPENHSLALLLPAMASGIIAFLGKFSGGFLAGFCIAVLHKIPSLKSMDTDAMLLRYGNYLFGLVTLLFSALLLSFGGSVPVLCFLGILCFHAAMPITLFELYCILPEHPGFAMGLSTLMLFLGSLPTAFIPVNLLPGTMILCILTLLAAGCMLASLVICHRAATATK